MLRAIREIQPTWVVGENVSGLVNWSGGLVFDEVQADLEAEGYEVIPFILPACAVNAPHRRDRVWFIAYRKGIGLQFAGDSRERGNGEDEVNTSEGREYALNDIEQVTMHPYHQGLERRTDKGETERKEKGKRQQPAGPICTGWANFPTQPPIRKRDDGVSDRLDGITFSKWRNESIKAAGNAIVPQVALNIFRAIEQFNNERINQIIH